MPSKKMYALLIFTIITSITIPIILFNLPTIDNNQNNPENPINPDNNDDNNTTQNDPELISRDEYKPLKIATAHYINLENISRISRFRSGIGHDFSDSNESCRSMKHYYQPKDEIDWTKVEIFSPINGTIFKIEPEWAGFQIHIQSDADPNIMIRIFHVDILPNLKNNDNLSAGDKIGVHSSSETMSDIAVQINLENVEYYTWSYFSFFEIMSDELFLDYADYGITTLDQVIISREERDANPIINCEFNSINVIEDWVNLS